MTTWGVKPVFHRSENSKKIARKWVRVMFGIRTIRGKWPSLPIFIVVSLLNGCASYHPQPLDPQVAAAAFGARSLSDPGVQDFLTRYGRPAAHWPKHSWGLSDLTLVALYESPLLAVQRAQLSQARAAIITAGEHPNPSIGTNTQHHSLTPIGILPWTFGFSLDLPIETAGKRGDRIEQADDLASAARFQVGETAWQIRTAVHQNLLSLYVAVETVKILETEASVRSKLLNLIEQRFAVGYSSTFEVTQAQLAAEKTRIALATARVGVATARATLAQTLGLPIASLESIRFRFAGVDRVPPVLLTSNNGLVRTALRHRLDLRVALAQYAAAESGLKLQIANQYPNLNLGTGYEWEEGDSRWAFNLPSMTLPIFNQNQGPIAQARANVGEKAAVFDALQDQIIGQIGQAEANYRGALQTLKTAQDIVASQANNQRVIEQRFAVGEIGSNPLLSGRLVSLVADQDRLTALDKAQQAFGVLENELEQPLGELTTAFSVGNKTIVSNRAGSQS